MMCSRTRIIALCTALSVSWSPSGICQTGQSARMLHEWNSHLTTLMVKDGFSPVLATRAFVYPNVAAYEAFALTSGITRPMGGQLKGLSPLRLPSVGEADPVAAALSAFHLVARELMYRPAECDSLFARQMRSLGLPVEGEAVEVGRAVAGHILSWAGLDGYKETKARPYYIPDMGLQYWRPTPPEFREALEPNWGTLRTFVLNEASDVTEPFAIPFSTEPGSEFHGLVKEVYDIDRNLTDEQRLIAEFWDDNPDLNTFIGHTPTSRRHINPASHWVSITGQALDVVNADIVRSLKVYTLISIAFADAKIALWHDKYRYNLVRPVTYIQEHINPDWMPWLVTPPFPEHTSGHSGCSMAVAVVLDALLGSDVSIMDTTLVQYGMPQRRIESFISAAEEVSMSRVYGGIHYRTGVEAGMRQGRVIGRKVLGLLDE